MIPYLLYRIFLEIATLFKEFPEFASFFHQEADEPLKVTARNRGNIPSPFLDKVPVCLYFRVDKPESRTAKLLHPSKQAVKPNALKKPE